MEVAIGLLLPVVLLFVRLALFPWMHEDAPFALVFVAVVSAAVLAGWRSGLLALAVGQVLVWYFILPDRWSFVIEEPAIAAALVLSTLAQLLILTIIGLYQREVAFASHKRESQMGLLEKALAEIDHRTSNNYQTVVALVLAQAKSATDDAVKDALQQVADRIRAIATASHKLAVASESLEQVRIAEHLRELCGEIEKGLSRPGIRIHCTSEDLLLDADDTVCISILVNELVTNALKHAFPADHGGTIRVAVAASSCSVELTVADDGVGIGAAGTSRGGGLGTRLIETFVRQLKAKHDVASDQAGTRHRIRFRKSGR